MICLDLSTAILVTRECFHPPYFAPGSVAAIHSTQMTKERWSRVSLLRDGDVYRLVGWDTDQFAMDIKKTTLAMQIVVEQGGLAPGTHAKPLILGAVV
eukprot:COSAG01_NODE_9121_length_2545_cov_2.343418_6_plen_98_part_00